MTDIQRWGALLVSENCGLLDRPEEPWATNPAHYERTFMVRATDYDAAMIDACEEKHKLRQRVLALEEVLRNLVDEWDGWSAGDEPLGDDRLEVLVEAARKLLPLESTSETSSKLPTWEDLRGAAPDATGDLSSEAFVRQRRNEWDKETPAEPLYKYQEPSNLPAQSLSTRCLNMRHKRYNMTDCAECAAPKIEAKHGE